MINFELSHRVGLSPPPRLERIKRLEDSIVIKAFAARTRDWPIVRCTRMVPGEFDFLLHCVASDLAAFQTFVIEEPAAAPKVDTVRTALTIRRIKDKGLADIHVP